MRWIKRSGPVLIWEGAAVQPNYLSDAKSGMRWVGSAANGVIGIVIHYLPEPSANDTERTSRVRVRREHEEDVNRSFEQVFRFLQRSAIFMDHVVRARQGHLTTEIRLTSQGRASGDASPSTVSIMLLCKIVEPILLGRSLEEALPQLTKHAEDLRGGLEAVLPKEFGVKPIVWGEGDESSDSHVLINPDFIGLKDEPEWHYGELRRGLNWKAQNNALFEINSARTWVTQTPEAQRYTNCLWPRTKPSLMPTLAVMARARMRVVVALRMHPTQLTFLEALAIQQRATEIRDDAHLMNLLGAKELVWGMIQVAGDDAEDVENVLNSFRTELLARPEIPGSNQAARQAEGVVRLLSVGSFERSICSFNLSRMEFLQWGFLSSELARSSILDSASDELVPETVIVDDSNESLRDPDVFMARDIESDIRLQRVRSLFTLAEASSWWGLPVVPPGGQAGVVSRMPNPFEQIPQETPAMPGRDTISLGLVQYRGRGTQQEFRVPLTGRVEDVAGCGDRVILVAGSPGSGKTNFCIYFLAQLWNEKPLAAGRRKNYPFLVIDPTRGNEFRGLLNSAENDLLLFTVGDNRHVPFRFNPFIVPREVCVQAHISRLMSCFKAAYEMWDPLPAIFEMAIRLAYEFKRAGWWEKRNPGKKWRPAEDFPASANEPFPSLKDIVAAMGKGEPDEENKLRIEGTNEKRSTIIFDQKAMWGGTTENAATIVASTFLRLASLQNNFSHIIADADEGDLVDIEELIKRPVVLELGMVGDSQALSLIMGFLIISIAGTIESGVIRKDSDSDMHMLVIEEAHRLLCADSGGGGGGKGGSSKAQAAEDLNNMLAEVRKYGQGVMLLDQRPGSLVGGAIDNAYLLAMHRLNEEKSFQQFCQVLNLTPDQRRYVRTELRPGELVSLDRRSGKPVLVRSANVATDKRLERITDSELAEKMRTRVPAVFLKAKENAPPIGMAALVTQCSADSLFAQAQQEFTEFGKRQLTGGAEPTARWAELQKGRLAQIISALSNVCGTTVEAQTVIQHLFPSPAEAKKVSSWLGV